MKQVNIFINWNKNFLIKKKKNVIITQIEKKLLILKIKNSLEIKQKYKIIKIKKMINTNKWEFFFKINKILKSFYFLKINKNQIIIIEKNNKNKKKNIINIFKYNYFTKKGLRFANETITIKKK